MSSACRLSAKLALWQKMVKSICGFTPIQIYSKQKKNDKNDNDGDDDDNDDDCDDENDDDDGYLTAMAAVFYRSVSP